MPCKALICILLPQHIPAEVGSNPSIMWRPHGCLYFPHFNSTRFPDCNSNLIRAVKFYNSTLNSLSKRGLEMGARCTFTGSTRDAVCWDQRGMAHGDTRSSRHRRGIHPYFLHLGKAMVCSKKKQIKDTLVLPVGVRARHQQQPPAAARRTQQHSHPRVLRGVQGGGS